ncbi:hypothetical protein AOLI_G00249250 [Acnodon oligacanthus]
MAAAAPNPASSVLLESGVAHAVLQWCRNPGGGCQQIEGVSTAKREIIKTLVRLHLAGWWGLQAVFQDAEKHWKQVEEQQVATSQMVMSLLVEWQPLASEDVIEAPPATEDISGTLVVSAAETPFPDVPASQAHDWPLHESLPTGRLGSPAWHWLIPWGAA